MNVAINKQVCYQSSAADRLPGLSHGLLIFEDPAGDELCDASGHALKNKNVKIRVRLEPAPVHSGVSKPASGTFYIYVFSIYRSSQKLAHLADCHS